MNARPPRSSRPLIALAAGAVAALVAVESPAYAADPGYGTHEGNAITRFFGRFGKTAQQAPAQPVPGYIRREADHEGALDVHESALDRNVNAYDKALNVGRALDEHIFGLPQSPENELKEKHRRSQLPGAQASRSGIFSGLDFVGTGLVSRSTNMPAGATIYSPPDSNAVFSDGSPTNAAPRIQDVAKLCNDPRALANILKRFNWVQKNTWETDIRMVSVEHPREVYYRTVGDYAYLSKRYCRASVTLNTGHTRHMVYQIVEDTGGAGGFYDRARFCVAGHDQMKEHEPACRVLRAL